MQFLLPNQPNITHLRKQAKSLLASAKLGEENSILRLQFTGKSKENFQLNDAQFTIAMEYGFSSWPKLKSYVDSSKSSNLKNALRDLKDGKMCILFDDEARENEGDFVVSAEKLTAQQVNFLSKYGRGTICLALSESKAKNFGLQAVKKVSDSNSIPNFAQSIDFYSTSTGVSASDKALTISKIIEQASNIKDFRSPGHVFTLIEAVGGLKTRAGHTEGCLDLMRRAGLKEGAVICEIMNSDGSMARLDDLRAIALEHQLSLVEMSDLI